MNNAFFPSSYKLKKPMKIDDWSDLPKLIFVYFQTRKTCLTREVPKTKNKILSW